MAATVHSALPMLGDDGPAVLTVDEAAAVLRISRNAAYAATQEWRDSGGASGLPCIVIGRTVRVPRSALAEMLAGH